MKNIFDRVDWISIVVPAVAVMVAEAMVDGLQVIDIVLGVAIGAIIAAFILYLVGHVSLHFIKIVVY